MSLPWFRMYAEFATDPKVQSMSETLQRRFIMFLCLQCAGEFEKLSDEELAFALRITAEDLAETKEVFAKKGLVTAGKITKWNKRQYTSDSSTERVRKYRKRQRNGDETLQQRSVTPSDTDTDTDSEEKELRKGSDEPSVDQALYADARKVFGKSIGGQISKAIKAHGKPWVLGVLEACRSKDQEQARGYLAAAMKGVKKPDEAEQRKVIP